MRPRLKALTLSGFRSFVDEGATLEFPDAGLVLLQGRNNDTGGSSGSGKSSVNLAIAFALGFCPLAATALSSWGGRNTLKVELTLETTAGEVRIRRSSSPVQMWVNGEQVRGGAKVVEERLRALLGVRDSETLGLLTYRGQRQAGLFLSKTDAEKKELLTQLLGLDRFETAIERGQARVKELEQKLVTEKARQEAVDSLLRGLGSFVPPEDVERRLAAAQEALGVHRNELERVRALEAAALSRHREAAQQAFKSFEGAIAEAKAAVAAVTLPAAVFDDSRIKEFAAAAAEAARRIKILEQEDGERLQEGHQQLVALDQKISVVRQLIAQEPGLLRDLARYEGELAAIAAERCPTCERPWDQATDRRSQMETRRSEALNALEEIKTAKPALEALYAEKGAVMYFAPNPLLPKLRDVQTRTQAQLAVENDRRRGLQAAAESTYRREHAEANGRLASLQAEQHRAYAAAVAQQDPVAQEAAVQVRSGEGAVSQTLTLVALLQQELTQARIAQGKRQEFEEASIAAFVATERALIELNEERDFLQAIGREGFLGAIFDEVLAEISDETNRILGSVANTRHCTLTFRSEAVTQKGTVKKAIVPVVNIGGYDASLEGGPSGGMLSTIELAVDLAVGAVLARRDGVSPGWLILDESFEGLDPVSKESCMEILARYAHDRLVIVVDHATEFKGLFSKSLTVEFKDGRSHFAKNGIQ
jgi:DNA repair exonuclease SbcCD ATPase subunit